MFFQWNAGIVLGPHRVTWFYRGLCLSLSLTGLFYNSQSYRKLIVIKWFSSIKVANECPMKMQLMSPSFPKRWFQTLNLIALWILTSFLPIAKFIPAFTDYLYVSIPWFLWPGYKIFHELHKIFDTCSHYMSHVCHFENYPLTWPNAGIQLICLNRVTIISMKHNNPCFLIGDNTVTEKPFH